jgi:glycosyltransferase involved in cell wall biosynthesis
MKIVHAVGWYFPDGLGGTEVYVAGLSERQRQAGHSVTVVSPSAGAAARVDYVHDGTRVMRYPVPLEPTRKEAQGHAQARGAEVLHEFLRETRPDIVHVHTLTTGLGVTELRAAKAAGAKVVVTNHLPGMGYICARGTLMRWGEWQCDGVIREHTCTACMLQSRGMPRAAAEIVAAFSPNNGSLPGVIEESRFGTAMTLRRTIHANRSLQNEMLSLADKFVVLNKRAMEVVLQNGGDAGKVTLNYLGASQTGVTRKPGPEIAPTTYPIAVGYVGRFNRVKGVPDLLRAFRTLPRDARITLTLCGPPEIPDTLRIMEGVHALVREDERVRVLDPVTPSEIPRLLASFDVLCVPSVWYENGPTVVNEAQLVGTPVIGSKSGAMMETIRDGVDGRLFEPGDWNTLAQILHEVVSDPAGTVDRWRRALPQARTMDDIARDYEALYRSLLN